MNYIKKRSLMSILLALVLVFSFATAASADDYSTVLTTPTGASSGTPTLIEANYSYTFTWLQPSTTTHYQLDLYYSGGSFSTGIGTLPASIPPGSNYGYFEFPPSLWQSLPTDQSILVVVTTYQYFPAAGMFSQNGYDDAWFMISYGEG